MNTYNPVLQLPCCCVPACLQMVLERREFPFSDQETIAEQLGIIIPPDAEMARYFQRDHTGDRQSFGYGTRIHLREFSLERFFKRNNYPLKFSYEVPDSATLRTIGECPSTDDLLACVRHNALAEGRADNGHVMVIGAIVDDQVTIINPGRELKTPYETYSIGHLVNAMRANGEENLGGIWRISGA